MKIYTPPIAVRPADARLLEQQKFAAHEICKVFQVTPEQVGIPGLLAAQAKAEGR